MGDADKIEAFISRWSRASGSVIELYAEFTRSGATYTPFPDARSHPGRPAR